MNANTLLADPSAIRLEHIVSRKSSLIFVVAAARRQAECPVCQQRSTRVHSRYTRKVADLPWQGVAVRLELHTRRFRCLNELCERSIFCERIPSIVAYYARHTSRLTSALELIGFAIGGEAGARVARQLAMTSSPDTLLRRIRRAILEEHPIPRVLGVDDWAFRRGTRYGTILVDLERRRPVDLLPDREAATLAAWLHAHPGVEVISRDRACAYSDGATDGAPSAVQVADRWHLLKNMGDAVQRVLDRKHAALRQAAMSVIPATEENKERSATALQAATPLTIPEREQQQRRARRLARYTEVITLWQQGVSLRAIARELHVSRATVKKFVRAGSFPEKAQRLPRRSIVDPFGDYLAARWGEGCHNATVLWREIKERGFAGPYNAVCRYLARLWRDSLPLRLQRRKRSQAVTTIKTPSARRTMWLLLGDEAKRQPNEPAFLARLLEQCPDVSAAQRLARQFIAIIRERKTDALDEWIAAAAASGLAEMRGFVAGLRRDLAAVKAALTYEWSNGQVEGQVNRLKMIKRMMYGRANFDLLRQRVLHAV